MGCEGTSDVDLVSRLRLRGDLQLLSINLDGMSCNYAKEQLYLARDYACDITSAASCHQARCRESGCERQGPETLGLQ